MNIRINALGRRELDDEICFRDVDSSSSDISCNQAHKLPLSITFKGNLSLLLGYISMEDLTTGFDVGVKEDLVCILLGVCEDNGLLMHSAIAEYDVLNNVKT